MKRKQYERVLGTELPAGTPKAPTADDRFCHMMRQGLDLASNAELKKIMNQKRLKRMMTLMGYEALDDE